MGIFLIMGFAGFILSTVVLVLVLVLARTPTAAATAAVMANATVIGTETTPY